MARHVLIWVQHLLGSGHLRRALTLAEACVAENLEVTLASGGPPSPWPAERGFDLVQLPAIRASDASFAELVTLDGRKIEAEVWHERRHRLHDLVRRLRPHAIVTEMFPFGRGAFRGEVLSLLAAAREVRPACARIASVRDVLVTKADATKYARMRDVALAHYEVVLVHGDPLIIPFSDSFPFAPELGPKLVHTGYVTPRPLRHPDAPRAEVLVSAGGGRVGASLLRAAVAARPFSCLAARPWRLVTGSGLDETAFQALQEQAGPDFFLERHHLDLRPLLRRALVSVSQAGYNTVVETLVAGAPMVLVPFARGSEDEQARRALWLEERRLAIVLRESELSPRALAVAIDRAAARGPRAGLLLDVDGAARSAALIRAQAHGG